MYKPSWPKDLDDAGWLTTYLVGGFGIGFTILVIWWKNEMPSLGDWGDYLGGIFAAIGFIWLIVAHVNSQRRIEEGQKELENQARLHPRGGRIACQARHERPAPGRGKDGGHAAGIRQAELERDGSQAGGRFDSSR